MPMTDGADVLERTEGASGELLLRRNCGDLEVIVGGTFLVSSANAASSIALISAGLDFMSDVGASAERRCPAAATDLDVLIGGLGLGYALDAALADSRIGRVTVAEFEPVIVDWFRRYGEGRAVRLAAAEAGGRARVVVQDVADTLRANADGFDVIALDTDNGPDWLVRDENGALYTDSGLALARDAVRPGGVVVFWSPERYDWFSARLSATFSRVAEVPARDHIGDRDCDYTMYVAQRGLD